MNPTKNKQRGANGVGNAIKSPNKHIHNLSIKKMDSYVYIFEKNNFEFAKRNYMLAKKKD